jgi:hypothetical protein
MRVSDRDNLGPDESVRFRESLDVPEELLLDRVR